MLGNIYVLDGTEAGVSVIYPVAIQHEEILVDLISVINVDVDIVSTLSDYAFKQVAHAEYFIDPAPDVCAAPCNGIVRYVFPVNRQIHQKPGLHILLDLLDQNDLSGHGGHVGIAGCFHGLAPYGSGIHVIAECSLVAPVERLQVDDGSIKVTGTGRLYGILWKARPPHGTDMLLKFFRRNDQ